MRDAIELSSQLVTWHLYATRTSATIIMLLTSACWRVLGMCRRNVPANLVLGYHHCLLNFTHRTTRKAVCDMIGESLTRVKIVVNYDKPNIILYFSLVLWWTSGKHMPLCLVHLTSQLGKDRNPLTPPEQRNSNTHKQWTLCWHEWIKRRLPSRNDIIAMKQPVSLFTDTTCTWILVQT